MKIAEIIPSKYMQALVDVPEDGTVTMTITNFTQEEGTGDDGPYKLNLLHFKEHEKPLKLNKGMVDVVKALHGSGDTDEWIGKQVILFNTTQGYQGKDFDVIRIKNRNPAAGKVATTVVKAAAGADANGEPPF